MLQAVSSYAPPGKHTAILARVEETETAYGAARKWSKGFRWTFVVQEGPHAGKELVKVTGADLRDGTALGDLVNSLYGRQINVGESVDPIADCVGKQYQVFATPNGDGAVIATITLINLTKE